jgi:hypothetical protein
MARSTARTRLSDWNLIGICSHPLYRSLMRASSIEFASLHDHSSTDLNHSCPVKLGDCRVHIKRADGYISIESNIGTFLRVPLHMSMYLPMSVLPLAVHVHIYACVSFPLCYVYNEKSARKRSSDLMQVPLAVLRVSAPPCHGRVPFESVTGAPDIHNFLHVLSVFHVTVASTISFSCSQSPNSDKHATSHLPVHVSVSSGLVACVGCSFPPCHTNTGSIADRHTDRLGSTNLPLLVASYLSIPTSTSFPCSWPGRCNQPVNGRRHWVSTLPCFALHWGRQFCLMLRSIAHRYAHARGPTAPFWSRYMSSTVHAIL